MTKQEFAKAVTERSGVSDCKTGAVEAIIDATFAEVASQALKGRLLIHKFGTFSMKTRKARKARNPKTGEFIDVPEQTKLTFKAAKSQA